MPGAPFVQVLGVAQDGGHPQPGCGRDCCRSDRLQPHLTTCVAVVDGARTWFLDAGPDFPHHLARIEAVGAQLAGILVTHGHTGHYAGLMYLGREAMNAARLPVWAAPRLAGFIRNNGPWEQLITAGNIDLRVIDPGQPVLLSDQVRVHAFTVPHRDEYSETLGFQVSGPGGSVLYVPDTDGWGGWEEPVENLIRSVDVALLDATFYDEEELPGRDIAAIAHPLVVDSLARFGNLEDSERAKIRFTHLNHSNPLLDPFSDETTRVVRAGMAVATEGDVYPL